jgi:hypothetical protein
LQKVGVTAMQIPTNAKYLKDILIQKQPLLETNKLLLGEGCSASILDGHPDKMGDPGIPTLSCLIDTEFLSSSLLSRVECEHHAQDNL